MTLAPRPRSTAADLLRLLAAWLAAIVLVQGIAAAQALGLGPLHRHREVAVAGVHTHSAAERHHHADAGVLVDVVDDAALDDTAFALTAALALMALGMAVGHVCGARRHVWRAALPWAWRTAVPAGLRKPPRRG